MDPCLYEIICKATQSKYFTAWLFVWNSYIKNLDFLGNAFDGVLFNILKLFV